MKFGGFAKCNFSDKNYIGLNTTICLRFSKVKKTMVPDFPAGVKKSRHPVFPKIVKYPRHLPLFRIISHSEKFAGRCLTCVHLPRLP